MTLSLAESLAALSEDQRKSILADLTEEQHKELQWDWSFWGRPEQQEPPGTWTTLLMLAGRGFGKTAAGSQMVRGWVCGRTPLAKGRYSRIALIGETAADARDVLVEGVSGILAVHPPDFRPLYESSKRRLTWPNGAVATLFNATEPDNLRGPNFDAAYCDELCIIAGSAIHTMYGLRPIELIRAGEGVWTRAGMRRVIRDAWCSSPSAEVWEMVTAAGRVLIGTGGHPVWVVGIGFVPLRLLRNGDTVCVWPHRKENGVEKLGIYTEITTAVVRASSCIARYIKRFTVLSWKAWTSITLMATRTITTSPIFKPSPVPSISAFMAHADTQLGQPNNIGKTPSRMFGAKDSLSSECANLAKRNSRASECEPSFAVALVPPETFASVIPTTTKDRVRVVRRLPNKAAVYNIEVDGDHEYFANDILTHNCKWQYARETWDMLQFGLRIGEHPRVIVTTTPRPIPLLKEIINSPNTVVIRGSTMDNRGNLAPSFLKQIQARYAGTRLGRQELNAEVLDDNPNALWTRDIIERNTVKQADVPSMTRIVVAIDPSGTKGNDEGDDIGIVAAGRGVDGKLYVMQDATVQASPAMWGAKAVKLYHELRADMIVAERNYGGAMVEHVIRTVDPNVPYKEVNASRAKWIRAEPVASLYERNLCKHVGALPKLEDEMCAFGLDGKADGKSPNRMDAMVWAATELMLQETRGAVSGMDWLDWDKPSYPQTSSVLACVRYLGNGQPPAITVWGVFVPGDARATAAPRVILLYSWTGHVHGPDLAAGLDVMCSLKERSKIETARVSKLFGLKAIPSYKVSRLLLETDGKPNAVQHELGKVLIEHDIVIEIVDAKRWGDEADRMSGVQHMFEDKMVYAPLSRRFAMQTVDNVEEFPNAANSGLASTATLALLYMRDTGMLLRSEEHGRMTTEAATFQGREKNLYTG